MSKLSPHEDKMLNLQYQMKQNNQDLQNFLKDLDNWETEIKRKDETLKQKKTADQEKLPPVRNSLDKKKMKKRVAKKKKEGESKPRRISGYDYRSWDKFDVDKACESVDRDRSGSSSEDEYETDEEWETERKKQAAVLEKDKGNEYFKKGDYDNAIECYTKGADLDPTNPLLPANRAMALLKQDKFAAAELDCSVALSLDPLYAKAYLRRISARIGLKKYDEAKADCQKVLQLEPQNKKAKSDLDLIEKELAKLKMVSHAEEAVKENKQAGIVKAITKRPEDRSKKPLKRIEIEEVGIEDDLERKAAKAKTLSAQSEAKKNIVERDSADFQRFTATSPADIVKFAAGVSISEEKNGNSVLLEEERSNIPNGDLQVKSNNPSDSYVCDSDGRLTLNVSDPKQTDKNKKADTNKHLDSDKSSESSSKKGDSSPRRVSCTQEQGLSIPTTSVQFQTDFRQLRRDIEAFYQYFKKIQPSEYCKLFGQFFDADVLLIVLSVLQKCYLRDGVDCYECLKCLTTVKRFSMVVMFLSSKDKQVLQEVFQHLEVQGQHTEADVNALAAKYEIR